MGSGVLARTSILVYFEVRKLKFLNQNGRQFRLHCVRGPIDTVGLGVHMAHALGAKHEFWEEPAPHSNVPEYMCVISVLLLLVCRDASVVDPEWLYEASPPSFQMHCRHLGRLHVQHQSLR